MRLSPAQIVFISSWIHAQDYWHCRTGWKLGCTAKERREQRTLDALKRKGAVAECGTITDAGRKAWREALERKCSA